MNTDFSQGSLMDLENIIENYDIPKYCYEEIINIYENYDS